MGATMLTGLKFILGIAGILILIKWLLVGAGTAVIANFMSPLLIGVIVIFILIYMGRKR